jgi:hypothetical protein
MGEFREIGESGHARRGPTYRDPGGPPVLQRRVRKRFQAYDVRSLIRTSLKTKSWDIARMRRDVLEKADDDFWTTAAYSMGENDDADTRRRPRLRLRARRAPGGDG